MDRKTLHKAEMAVYQAVCAIDELERLEGHDPQAVREALEPHRNDLGRLAALAARLMQKENQ